MTTLELISLIASLSSLILAVIAIWLSITFYRMSSQIGEDIKDAAKGISANVERLEKLFDRLYSDTFSMVKDTVSDMRKHIWPEDLKTKETVTQETEKRADESIDKLRGEIKTELSKILDRQSGTDKKLSTLSHEMGHLVDRAISKTREVEVEAREQTLREHLLEIIHKYSRRKKDLEADTLVEEVPPSFGFKEKLTEIEKMHKEGIVEYDGDAIGPYTIIKLVGT